MNHSPETGPPAEPLGFLDRVLGALLSGLVAGAAMYATLAAFAVAQGRGAGYPFQAVQAMMSGRRVLPDHPVSNVRGPSVTDWVMGPLYFFAPAVIVALLVAWWVWRGSRQKSAGVRGVRRTAVLAPAVALTALFFVVFVLLLGYQEVRPGLQRISTGYGVRELGVLAWLVAHIVYALTLTFLVGPISRALAGRGGPKQEFRHRGEQPAPADQIARTSAR